MDAKDLKSLLNGDLIKMNGDAVETVKIDDFVAQ